MKVKFLGAAGTVTGSGYLLTTAKEQLLIDFGMFQGTEKEKAMNRARLGFNPARLTATILTHAHLDHCGRLPLIVKEGFKGPIYATAQTKSLTEIILFDSAKIAASDERETDVPALYSDDDVVRTLDKFQEVKYSKPLQLGSLKITLRNAGHILGSASIEILDNASNKKLVISGDLGNFPDYLMPPTEFINSADFVIMESTYGGKTHPNESAKDLLKKAINHAERTKSTLLIPSFAIQKTQTLLYLIKELKKEHQVKSDTKIFLDSPMAIRATQIYRENLHMYNKRVFAKIQNEDPFDFPGLEITLKGKNSRNIESFKGSKVIIAGSGMMSGGRVLDHAIKLLPKKTTTILFVGYQAEGTIGREIKDGAGWVEIEGKTVNIKAQIEKIESLSTHADQTHLLRWLQKIHGVKKAILTHGEDWQRIMLASEIRRKLGIPEVIIPAANEELEL